MQSLWDVISDKNEVLSLSATFKISTKSEFCDGTKSQNLIPFVESTVHSNQAKDQLISPDEISKCHNQNEACIIFVILNMLTYSLNILVYSLNTLVYSLNTQCTVKSFSKMFKHFGIHLKNLNIQFKHLN